MDLYPPPCNYKVLFISVNSIYFFPCLLILGLTCRWLYMVGCEQQCIRWVPDQGLREHWRLLSTLSLLCCCSQDIFSRKLPSCPPGLRINMYGQNWSQCLEVQADCILKHSYQARPVLSHIYHTPIIEPLYCMLQIFVCYSAISHWFNFNSRSGVW